MTNTLAAMAFGAFFFGNVATGSVLLALALVSLTVDVIRIANKDVN